MPVSPEIFRRRFRYSWWGPKQARHISGFRVPLKPDSVWSLQYMRFVFAQGMEPFAFRRKTSSWCERGRVGWFQTMW